MTLRVMAKKERKSFDELDMKKLLGEIKVIQDIERDFCENFDNTEMISALDKIHKE